METAIRARFPAAERLLTPVEKRAYDLTRIDERGIALKLGTRANPIRINWRVLEGVAGFLRDKGFVYVGEETDGKPEEETLDEYLRPHTNKNVSRWIAAILSEAEVVRLKRFRPMQIALADPD